MASKTDQLQIRVTPRQKDALRRQARAAGVDVSTYVLARALPSANTRFVEILRALERDDDRRFALAELSDFLEGCAPMDFGDAVAGGGPSRLLPWVQNYVAAMVEFAADRKRVPPPTWVAKVEPLDEPHFATPMRSLRMHLLLSAPVVFKRRNIFVDASIGARV